MTIPRRKLHPRLWADVPAPERTFHPWLERRAPQQRCQAAIHPQALSGVNGKYIRCLKLAKPDGLCWLHQRIFARWSASGRHEKN